MPTLTTPELNDIDQEIELFLDQVSEQYIAEMAKNGVWGGDLELIAIGNILNIKIEVHKTNKDHPAEPLLGPENAPNTIKLLLKGEASGNGHYSVINNKNEITTIAGDGNCLFNACVTACQEQSITTTPSITTAAELRKAVYEYLTKEQTTLQTQAKSQQEKSINTGYITQEQATEADLKKRIKQSDPIRSRFEVLINCEESDFEYSKKALPNISLRDQAIELRQKRIDKNNLIETTRKTIFTKYQENIQKNTQLNNIKTNTHQDTIQIHDTKNEQQLLATIKQDAIECPILPDKQNLSPEQQQLFIEFLKTQVELNKASTEPLTVEANNFNPQDLDDLTKLLTEQKINIKLKLSNTDDYIYQPTNKLNPPKP
jgi:hypothetical protein